MAQNRRLSRRASFHSCFRREDIDSHSQDLDAILLFGIQLTQLRECVIEHAELRVTFRDPNYLVEGHRS